MSQSSPYFNHVNTLAHSLPTSIVHLGVPRVRPPMPTQATSDFLINQHLGNWGEDIVRRSIQSSVTGFTVVKYGRGGDTVAGEHGFREFYTNYQNELEYPGGLFCGSGRATLPAGPSACSQYLQALCLYPKILQTNYGVCG